MDQTCVPDMVTYMCVPLYYNALLCMVEAYNNTEGVTK